MAVTGNMSYYYKRKVADLALGNQAYTPVTGIFIALFQSAIDYSATGGWPGEIGLRYSATNNLVNWSTALTASGTAYKFNTTDFVFPTATANWGTAQFFQILDAATNGNAIHWGELATAKIVGSGDVFRLLSGNIAATLT